jgi:hypothetical protein
MGIAISIFLLASLVYFLTHVRSWQSFCEEFVLFLFIVSLGSAFLFGGGLVEKYQLQLIQRSSTVQQEVKQSAIKDTEAPKIQIIYPEDGAVFGADIKNIIVKTKAWDAIDPSPSIQGDGIFWLKPGFNSIVVTSTDQSGNVGSAYVVIEKK